MGRGRRKKQAEPEHGCGETLDLRKVLTKEKRELAKLNDRISNLQDRSWIQDQVQRTSDKRDRQELTVLSVEDACKKLGLIQGDQLEFPGTPQNPSEPRHNVRITVEGHQALLSGPIAALPAPRVECDHDGAGWDDVDDLWRRCRGCGVMDMQPCPEEPAEQPDEAASTLQEA